MLEGKTFLPVTGTPIRKMACISRPLADADPVPLAVAILKAKSLTRSISFQCARLGASRGEHQGHTATVAGTTESACGIKTANFRMSHAYVGHLSAHRPQCRQ